MDVLEQIRAVLREQAAGGAAAPAVVFVAPVTINVSGGGIAFATGGQGAPGYLDRRRRLLAGLPRHTFAEDGERA